MQDLPALRNAHVDEAVEDGDACVALLEVKVCDPIVFTDILIGHDQIVQVGRGQPQAAGILGEVLQGDIERILLGKSRASRQKKAQAERNSSY
jgi:hypothetical protein